MDLVKGADGWEFQQAGEERLGVMPTLEGRDHCPSHVGNRGGGVGGRRGR